MATNRLREFRLARGLVQVELAVKAGVSPSTIAAIEKGYPPSQRVQRKIAHALRRPIADIWPTVDDQAPVPVPAA